MNHMIPKNYADVPINTVFHDPFSGVDFKKIDVKEAVCVTTGVHEGKVDEFFPDDMVQVLDEPA